MFQTLARWLRQSAVIWSLLALAAIIVWTVTFFIARDAGVKDGQRQAREEIQANDSITDGPDRLLE